MSSSNLSSNSGSPTTSVKLHLTTLTFLIKMSCSWQFLWHCSRSGLKNLHALLRRGWMIIFAMTTCVPLCTCFIVLTGTILIRTYLALPVLLSPSVSQLPRWHADSMLKLWTHAFRLKFLFSTVSVYSLVITTFGLIPIPELLNYICSC
jgi:hypothetical protein